MRALLFLIPLCGSVAIAQPVSFGIRGGVPFTGAFSSSGFFENTSSGATSYLVGPMLEIHLPLGFSVEGDGLYHPLNLKYSFFGEPAAQQTYSFQSWEFPVLAKYRFMHTPVVKPLVEAGPVFRATSQALDGSFSKDGFAIGGGVEIKVAHIRIEPDLRYLRWGASGSNAIYPSNVNQAEFTLGLAF